MTATAILTFTLRAGPGLLAQIEVDEEGAVTRMTGRPGTGERLEVGWWRGTLDQSVVGLARSLAASTWPGVERSRPPAAGAWTATAAGGRRGLWGASDDVGVALRSLQSECASVADSPVAVAALSAQQAGPEDPVMLTLESRGAEAIDLTLRDEQHVPGETVVFITDEAEVIGYLGDVLTLPPGLRAVGVLRGRTPGPSGLALTGSMATDGEDAQAIGLAVALTTE